MIVSEISVVDQIAVESNGKGWLNDRAREQEFYVVLCVSM
jgi:hypothetical protein